MISMLCVSVVLSFFVWVSNVTFRFDFYSEESGAFF